MGGSTRVSWRDRTFDTRTRDMLVEVQRLVGDDIELIPVQGSYSDGEKSAGTHRGGGAVDLRTSHLNGTEEDALVRAMRLVGFAAWFRFPPDFDEHIHGIAIGCPDLDPAARDQVTQYRNGQNGLKGRGPDEGPDVPPTTWEKYLASREPEELFTVAQFDEIMARLTVLDRANQTRANAIVTQHNGDARYLADLIVKMTRRLQDGIVATVGQLDGIDAAELAAALDKAVPTKEQIAAELGRRLAAAKAEVGAAAAADEG